MQKQPTLQILGPKSIKSGSLLAVSSPNSPGLRLQIPTCRSFQRNFPHPLCPAHLIILQLINHNFAVSQREFGSEHGPQYLTVTQSWYAKHKPN